MGAINNNILITNQGNAIAKSDAGKKVGTAVAVTGTAASLVMPMDKFVKVNGQLKCKKTTLLKQIRDFVKGKFTNEFKKEAGKVAKEGDKVGAKIYNKLGNMSKGGRVGLAVAYIATALTSSMLLCRGIGKLVDKARNNRHAKQADAQAITDKINAK